MVSKSRGEGEAPVSPLVLGTIKLMPSQSRRPAEFEINCKALNQDEVLERFEKTVKNEASE